MARFEFKQGSVRLTTESGIDRGAVLGDDGEPAYAAQFCSWDELVEARSLWDRNQIKCICSTCKHDYPLDYTCSGCCQNGTLSDCWEKKND